MATDIYEILSQSNWPGKRMGPLYLQLCKRLENAIRSGELSEGEPLPSERKIAEISDLSRVTVRKAVAELIKDGYVVQRPGSGTSVAPRLDRVQQSLSRLTSFSEDMQRRGAESRSVLLDKGIYTPSPQEIVALGLVAGCNVARISRLRIADERPLAIENASLSSVMVPDPDEIGESLYAYLALHGNKPSRAIQRISASILSSKEAELLEVPQGSAGLSIERRSYLKSGEIVEFTQSVYRGDAYDFVAELYISDD